MHFTSHVDIYILPATLQVYLSYEVLDAVELDKMKSLVSQSMWCTMHAIDLGEPMTRLIAMDQDGALICYVHKSEVSGLRSRSILMSFPGMISFQSQE